MVRLVRGDVVCEPSSPPFFVYLIKNGTFAIEAQSPVPIPIPEVAVETDLRYAELKSLELFLKGPENRLVRLSTVSGQEFVGEETVFYPEKRYAFRVVCLSETAKLYRLTGHAFRMLPKPIIKIVSDICQAKVTSRVSSLVANLKVRVGAEPENDPPPNGSSPRLASLPSLRHQFSYKYFAKSTIAAYQKGDPFSLLQMRQLIDNHRKVDPHLAAPKYVDESYSDFRRTEVRTTDGRIRVMTLRNCRQVIEENRRARPNEGNK